MQKLCSICIKINKYKSQMNQNIFKLMKWEDVWNRYWCLGPEFPRWSECRGLAQTTKGWFLRSLACTFRGNGSFFSMWPCLAKMHLCLWHRGPRQSPRAIWQRRIHTMVKNLKRKIGRHKESCELRLTQSPEAFLPLSPPKQTWQKGPHRQPKPSKSRMVSEPLRMWGEQPKHLKELWDELPNFF